jgi:hypothetical protein
MDPLFSIPAPRRSARVAAREGRRTPGEVAEELYTAMLALEDISPEDLPVLYKNGYLSLCYDFVTHLHPRVKVSLKTRRLFNPFLRLWHEYHEVLDHACQEPIFYSCGPDGVEYKAWSFKMKDEAYLSFTSFIYEAHLYTITEKEDEW